jgi:hypothetical protein
MFLKQYYLGCLAHASYMLGDEASSTAKAQALAMTMTEFHSPLAESVLDRYFPDPTIRAQLRKQTVWKAFGRDVIMSPK